MKWRTRVAIFVSTVKSNTAPFRLTLGITPQCLKREQLRLEMVQKLIQEVAGERLVTIKQQLNNWPAFCLIKIKLMYRYSYIKRQQYKNVRVDMLLHQIDLFT